MFKNVKINNTKNSSTWVENDWTSKLSFSTEELWPAPTEIKAFS